MFVNTIKPIIAFLDSNFTPIRPIKDDPLILSLFFLNKAQLYLYIRSPSSQVCYSVFWSARDNPVTRFGRVSKRRPKFDYERTRGRYPRSEVHVNRI